MRIVVLGGGFGGVATVRHLERALHRRTDVEITLVSRENSFVLTPLLFEACSGSLELRHCAQPIRAAPRRSRFIEATVESVDLERQLVRAVAPESGTYGLPRAGPACDPRSATPRGQHQGGHRRTGPFRVHVPLPRDDGVTRSYARRRVCLRCAAHGLSGLVVAPELLPLSNAALGPAVAHCPRLDCRTVPPAGHHAG